MHVPVAQRRRPLGEVQQRSLCTDERGGGPTWCKCSLVPSVMQEAAQSMPEARQEVTPSENIDDLHQSKKQRTEPACAPDNERLRRRVAYVPANQPVLLRLPSSMTKQVVLEPGKMVSIGKFGSFPADQVIGRPYGPTYEIKDDGNLEIMHKDVAEALGMCQSHASGERGYQRKYL